MKKEYLGDGVYIEYDDNQFHEGLILTTENGIEVTNTIFLEATVYENLILYVENLKKHFQSIVEKN